MTSALTLAQALVLAAPKPAAAQTVWNGNTSDDWTVGSNWSGGVPTTGQAEIETTSPNPTVLGVSGAATGTTGILQVGKNGNARLTVQNGSTLSSTGDYHNIGDLAGSTGVATVTGTGSTWNVNIRSGTYYALRIANVGTGTLNITDGGLVAVSDTTIIARSPDGEGTLNLTSGGTLANKELTRGSGTT